MKTTISTCWPVLQAELNKYKSISAARDGLISEDVPTLGNTTSNTQFNMDSNMNEWATAGFFRKHQLRFQGPLLVGGKVPVMTEVRVSCSNSAMEALSFCFDGMERGT